PGLSGGPSAAPSSGARRTVEAVPAVPAVPAVSMRVTVCRTFRRAIPPFSVPAVCPQTGRVEAGYAAIVLAGGRGRRIGGRDKPALPVGGRSMLRRVLDAVAGADPRVIVGPVRSDVPAGVAQVREHPPGGGPVAALAARLA